MFTLVKRWQPLEYYKLEWCERLQILSLVV